MPSRAHSLRTYVFAWGSSATVSISRALWPVALRELSVVVVWPGSGMAHTGVALRAFQNADVNEPSVHVENTPNAPVMGFPALF